MAIKKEIENEYKAKFNYHKISEVRIYNDNGNIQLRMITESYVDENARNEGAKAVKTENIIENADFALQPFYAILKAKFPMFQDGEDLFEDKENTDAAVPRYTQQDAGGEMINQWNEENKEESEEEE